MTNWIKPACTVLALAAMTTVARAQMASEQMKPAGMEKSFTGCVEAGTSAGTYTLTHITADTGAGASHDAMQKDAMAKDAAVPTMLSISSKTVDLSKHVGHKVTVTGTMGPKGSAMGASGASTMTKTDTMAKRDTMAKSDSMAKSASTAKSDKSTPAFMVSSLKMVASTCGG